MRLLIADNDGNVLEVLDDLEGYDLAKPFARQEVAEAVQRAMEKIHEADRITNS